MGQDEASATELINRFLETYQDGQIKIPEDILTYINSSCEKSLTTPSAAIRQSVGEMAA